MSLILFFMLINSMLMFGIPMIMRRVSREASYGDLLASMMWPFSPEGPYKDETLKWKFYRLKLLAVAIGVLEIFIFMLTAKPIR